MNNIPEILQDKKIKASTKKSIKNIQLYALHTDLDVLETFSKPHFFLRKPYEGELEFAEKNYNINFPEIKVKFVRGSDLIQTYPKGSIPLKDHAKFFD